MTLNLPEISAGLCNHFDTLVSHFDLPMKQYGDMWTSSCFLHCGNNPGALVLYTKGHTRPGYWTCYTRNCHNIFKNSILGFLRGVLSVKYYDWNLTGKVYPFWETVRWAKKFLEGKPIALVKNVEQKKVEGGIPKSLVRANLQIPAPYFLNRGYPATLLDKYDIGLSNRPKTQMYRRSVVPVYDETGQLMVGCTGRSIYEECSRCHLYHSEMLPCDLIKQKGVYTKWRNSKYFKKGQNLFNLWFARDIIKKMGRCILVEGPGDVLKLEMAGIHNSLGTFGCRISDSQQIRTEALGIKEIVVLYDSDEAGLKGREQIRRKLKKSHKLYFPKLDAHDVGELSVEEIQKIDWGI